MCWWHLPSPPAAGSTSPGARWGGSPWHSPPFRPGWGAFSSRPSPAWRQPSESVPQGPNPAGSGSDTGSPHPRWRRSPPRASSRDLQPDTATCFKRRPGKTKSNTSPKQCRVLENGAVVLFVLCHNTTQEDARCFRCGRPTCRAQMNGLRKVHKSF